MRTLGGYAPLLFVLAIIAACSNKSSGGDDGANFDASSAICPGGCPPNAVCIDGSCVVLADYDASDDVTVDSSGGPRDATTEAEAGPDATTNDAPSDVVQDAFPIPPDAPAGYGDPCNLPSDCPADLRCGYGGRCVWQCNTTADCFGGECCVGHLCEVGAVCASDAGASDAAPMPCTTNAQCDDGNWCNGFESCLGGVCAAATDVPCQAPNQCVTVVCNGAAQTCQYIPQQALDVDGDGHIAYACGGDDCDDQDPAIYTGHPEWCDGKDNDCNGLIDDYSRHPYGPVIDVPGAPTGEDGLAAPLGGNWVLFESDPRGLDVALVSTGDGDGGAPFDAGGGFDAGAFFQTVDPAHANADLWAAAGGASTALVLYDWNNGNYANYGFATLISKSLGLVASVTLDATAGGDVVWTGTEYAVAFAQYAGNDSVRFVTFIDETGAQPNGTYTIPAAANGIDGFVRIAASGATVAVVHDGPSQATTNVVVLDSSLNVLGSATLANCGAPMAISGTTNGYVVLCADSTGSEEVRMTPVSVTGVAGASALVTTPSGIYGFWQGNGAFEGAGAGFLLLYNQGTYFAYQSATYPNNPFEMALASGFGITRGSSFNVAQTANTLWLMSYNVNTNAFTAQLAGCAPGQ